MDVGKEMMNIERQEGCQQRLQHIMSNRKTPPLKDTFLKISWQTKVGGFFGGLAMLAGGFSASAIPNELDLLKQETPVVQEVGTGFLDKHIDAQFKAQDGSSLELRIERNLSDRRLPFSVGYKVLGLPEGVKLYWDLNNKVDSDGDGQFKNDIDAEGAIATMIYNTNRTPFTATVRAVDDQGKKYSWQDTFKFTVQNGDKVILDAEGFIENPSSVKWSVFNGDATDTNIKINAPSEVRTTLTSTYPGVTTVSLNTSDSMLNPQQYDTTLYVFNKHPEMFKYRGMGLGINVSEDFSYFARNFNFLKVIGVNYVKIPIDWRYSINSQGNYIIHRPYTPSNVTPGLSSSDSTLEQIISLAHEGGLGVELNLELIPDHGVTVDRNHSPMSEEFFEGPQGYFAFVQHYIDLANRNNVEVFVGKTEMSCTDFQDARPWMDKLIEMMKTGLVNTRYTVESFLGQWNTPKPWNPNYGVDLSKLDEIEWSAWHPKVGPYPGASIQEIKDSFETHVLQAFIQTHNLYPELKQRIGEFGFNSAKGGESIMEYDPGTLDFIAQKKGLAGTMRALYDFIGSGNDYLEGVYPHNYSIERAFDRSYYNSLGGSSLFKKPALEELYTFYSSEPQELPDIPIYCLWGTGRTQFYIDPTQDVKTIGPSDEVVQDFEGNRSPLTGPKVTTVPAITNVSAKTTNAEVYKGDNSLQIHFETPIGDVPHQAPYARGGEAVVVPKVSVNSWDGIDSISLAIKREDPNLGIVLLLFQGHNYEVAYSQRLPLQKVGEWEEIGVPLDNFSRILGSGNNAVRDLASRGNFLTGEIGIALYSINGEPVNTDVYIDRIAISRQVGE